jgi:tetratricopeptide (TPR) repeat protein
MHSPTLRNPGYLGETETAIEHFSRGMRLDPLDPWIARTYAGTSFAYLLSGRHAEAAAWADKALAEEPTNIIATRIAAASNALLGRAKDAMKAMERMRRIDPALRMSNLPGLVPFRRPQDFTLWAEGLRLAGLPE